MVRLVFLQPKIQCLSIPLRCTVNSEHIAVYKKHPYFKVGGCFHRFFSFLNNRLTQAVKYTLCCYTAQIRFRGQIDIIKLFAEKTNPSLL